MVTVETIMKCLTADSPMPPSPNVLINKLKPILGASERMDLWLASLFMLVFFFSTESWSLVLDLWKHLHISKLQSEHGIQDSTVEDIVPLTAAALLNRPVEETEEDAHLISERVKVIDQFQLLLIV